MKELGVLINYRLNICRNYDVSAGKQNKTTQSLTTRREVGWRSEAALAFSGLWSDHTKVLGSVVGTTILGGY